jgi:hypothetical protein
MVTTQKTGDGIQDKQGKFLKVGVVFGFFSPDFCLLASDFRVVKDNKDNRWIMQ